MPQPKLPTRLIWSAPFPYIKLTSEQRAENLRSLALVIEETIDKKQRPVTLDTPVARLVARALLELADRIDLD